MNVLFVFSGNSPYFDIAPFIKSQGESLIKQGVIVDYFAVKGKGIRGYFKNILLLRKSLKKHKYDIIHAHYAFCGLVAILALPKAPIIVSFMGSDISGEYDHKSRKKIKGLPNIIISKLIQLFVDRIIVKSPNLYQRVYTKRKTTIVPNGIELELFKPASQKSARERLGIEHGKKLVLFLGNPLSLRKNFALLKDSLQYLKTRDIEVLTPYPVPHKKIPEYLNAADVLVLASFGEGSPNIVKEAMACDTPVVATEVGDVSYLFGDTPGYFISSFRAPDMAEKIEAALALSQRPEGRDRIKELGLDSDTVADKIIGIYKNTLSDT